jgi:hypothetical protein
MNTPDRHDPQEMNWADYCDSLRNTHWLPHAQSQQPVRVSERARDPAAAGSDAASTRRMDTANVSIHSTAA